MARDASPTGYELHILCKLCSNNIFHDIKNIRQLSRPRRPPST